MFHKDGTLVPYMHVTRILSHINILQDFVKETRNSFSIYNYMY